MVDQLPSNFDLIVVGTGLTESIVAAAASRVGKTVLHIDQNEFYGLYWASFNLQAFQNYIEGKDEDHKAQLEGQLMHLKYSRIANAKQNWHVGDMNDSCVLSKADVMKESRSFNIDLVPKLLFARGQLVELLISSSISRYAEFRAVDRLVTLVDGDFKTVPCSRSDVFISKDVSVVEKRLLMKFFSKCLKFESDDDYTGKTFDDYLSAQKLSSKLKHYILNDISMSDSETPCSIGIERTKKFIESLGRYGNTPFLFPMYGCGEIPQCFCRLCAVFGGIYCLKRKISNISISTNNENEKKFTSITSNGQEIAATNILFGPECLASLEFPATTTDCPSATSTGTDTDTPRCGNISRGIFITNKPLNHEKGDGGGVIFMRLVSKDRRPSFVLQLSSPSKACPVDYYIIHISCKTVGDPETDIKPFIDQLFSTKVLTHSEETDEKIEKEAIKLLYSCYFTIPECGNCRQTLSDKSKAIEGVHFCCGPIFDLDYDLTISQAQNIFARLYPDEVFLPRAPEPDEIVLTDDEEVKTEEEVKSVDIQFQKITTEEEIKSEEVVLKAETEEVN